MLSEENFDDLKVKGYTVVKNVLTTPECDNAIGQYREWVSQFTDETWPLSMSSLMMRYNVGHMVPTWEVRLKAKSIFAQLWKTDKLLTSFDAIAIGRPPEDGQEAFYAPGQSWLHLDQSPSREGLHAYQGAIYLEETAADDWTMEVMEGSHLYFKTFFENNPSSASKSEMESYYELAPMEVKEFQDHQCEIKRVSCPKGGMILWDSRLVHANARPIKGRQNPGRWRFVNFVSMTPAIWADKKEIERKQYAYKSAIMSTHWSSQGVGNFFTISHGASSLPVKCPTEVPEVAKSVEAMRLAGMLPYDFQDGAPTGLEFKPTWKNEAARNRSFDQTV